MHTLVDPTFIVLSQAVSNYEFRNAIPFNIPPTRAKKNTHTYAKLPRVDGLGSNVL